ncbi:putative lipoprotein [Leptospira kirschneri str. 200803703]|nr:putative lipoprotein [Leptospira kirschneri str. 200803703]EMO68994.1 putative lipoprotein [Leptospira kirschneri str. 200803703]
MRFKLDFRFILIISNNPPVFLVSCYHLLNEFGGILKFTFPKF